MFNEYPHTDLHELNLDWVIKKVKELSAAWVETSAAWQTQQEAFDSLRAFVNDYFDNLDVQEEINNKIDDLVTDGTLSELIAPYVASGLPAVVATQLAGVVAQQITSVVAAQLPAQVAAQLPAIAAQAAADEVSAWLVAHINPDTGYVIDDTLTVQGAAADAKAAGDAIGELKSALTDCLSNIAGVKIDINNYTTYFSSLSAIKENSWYYITGIHDIDNTVPTERACIFINYNIASNIDFQFIVETGNNPKTYVRYKTSGSGFGTWRVIGLQESDVVTMLADFSKNIVDETVTSSNYSNFFSSFNDMNTNGWYYMSHPDSIDASSPTTKNCFFIHFTIASGYKWQMIIETGDNPKTYVRYKVSNWGSWRQLNPDPQKTSFVVDINGGDYTSLTECLVYIRTNHIVNADVTIKPGVYDVYEEMKTKYGADYWTNFNPSTSEIHYGLPLSAGIYIHGDAGVIVKCENDQPLAESSFSLFYPYSSGGATIENLCILAKNVRYGIHIEFSSYSGDGCYTIKNCSMFIDNSESTNWHHAAGIGAGSGINTLCVFENNDIHPSFDVAVVKKSAILWHNTGANTSSNKVIIKGNYCDGDSTISVASNGTSTEKSPCVISDNSVGSNILVLDPDDNVNIEVYEWNNVLRS